MRLRREPPGPPRPADRTPPHPRCCARCVDARVRLNRTPQPRTSMRRRKPRGARYAPRSHPPAPPKASR
eukprot:7184093-Prymnesium_polylepis.2